MTDILPPAGWLNVRQLETNEFATGGANGNMNEQAKSLAARSELLKQYAALPYESKTGGYALNERVQLTTGDVVRSTIASNVNNPNENMTGWINSLDQRNIDKDLTVTVGPTGQYPTINAALSYLSRFKKVFTGLDITAEILIKSGFVVQEQINVEGVDLSWITISSEDAEVTVDRASLVTMIGRWYSFMRFRNSNAPIINTLFSMNTTGTAALKTNCYLIHSEMWVNYFKGFKNAGERNVDITQASTFVGMNGIFTGAGTVGLRPATASKAYIQYADVSNCVTGMACGTSAAIAANNLVAKNCSITAVEVQGGVSVELNEADLTGSGVYGLYAHGRCTVNANAANMSNSLGIGVRAQDGANVDLDSAIVNNCLGTAGVFAIDGAIISGSGITAVGNVINMRATKGAVIITDLATLTGATSVGLFAAEGGKIIATNSNYRRGSEDSTSDASVSTSGEIVVNASTGGSVQTPDVRTPRGIIRKGNRVSFRGIVTIPAGQSSATISHDITSTPVIVLTPRVNLSGNSYWVSAVNSTSFTVTVATAVSIDTGFFWMGAIN